MPLSRALSAFSAFSADTTAAVVSTELILITTISVVGLMTGLVSVRDAVVAEISDLAGSVQDINQCYSFSGVQGHSASGHGSSFDDSTDWCDDAEDAPGVADNCITFDGEPEDESGDDGGGELIMVDAGEGGELFSASIGSGALGAASLGGGTFADGVLTDGLVRDATITGATVKSKTGTISDATITGATLTGVSLSGASLSEGRLSGGTVSAGRLIGGTVSYESTE